MYKLFDMNLRKFDVDLNVQTTSGDPASMRIFYDRNLVLHAQPALIHDQFGQKRNIPAGNGKKVVFRKLSPLPKATQPLVEGSTPTGNSMIWTNIESSLQQYGDYITISDVLQLTGVDNNLIEAGEILAAQAGETLDSITREVISAGTNVQYASAKMARHLLVGGQESGNDYLTVEEIKKASRSLKRNNAKRINGFYVGIIHPDVVYDLTSDPAWENVRTYCDPKDMYYGEAGRIHGVRFIETSEAKVFSAPALSAESASLTIATVSEQTKTITISQTLTSAELAALAGRKVLICGVSYTIASATSSGIVLAESFASGDSAPSSADVVYPGEAGAIGRNIYSTLILGADAYGVTTIEGGGLRNIVKQLGSGGTADPLDQRATTGWKALKTAEILVDEYMVRIETTSSYS